MAKLVECVPNFSVSREKDPAVFQGLVDTANSMKEAFIQWVEQHTGGTE